MLGAGAAAPYSLLGAAAFHPLSAEQLGDRVCYAQSCDH